MYNFRKSKKGFTLIELMVVVAIIAVLALLGLRLYATQQDKAKEAIVRANAGTVQVQIQTELVDDPGYLVSEAVADSNDENITNLRNPFLSTANKAIALADATEAVTTPDNEGMVGVYKSGTRFYIMAFGNDGVPIPDYTLTAEQ